MAYPITAPFPQFRDRNGDPLENGYIYIGTANLDAQTNPITAYWDAAGTMVAQQPIRTSGGYPVWNGTAANIYVTADNFSTKILDKNGTLVYSKATYDGQGTSINMQFLQSGTGAVPRTVQSKLRDVVSVLDFGAKGDGVTNDYAAIQAAIDATNSAGGGVIYFPAGTYIVSSTVLLKNNCSLQGSGVKTTTIKLGNSANVNIFEASGGTASGVGLYDMTVNGNQANNTAGGVYLVGTAGSRGPCYQIERIRFTNIRTAIYGAGNRGAVAVAGSDWSVMKDCDFINNDYAQIALLWSASDSQVSGVYIGTNGRSYAGTSYGLWLAAAGVFFTNCYFGGTQKGPQVRLFDATSNKFTSCIFDNAGSNNVEIAGSSVDNSFVGGQITYSNYSDGGTYYSVYSSISNSRTIFIGVKFETYLGVAPPAYGYYEPAGVSGACQLIGCEFYGTWGVASVSVPAASTTQFVGCKNYDVTTVGTLQASTKLDVRGPYPASAPSTSSVPLGRFNGGGAISLWAGTYAYTYTWLQGIQDDGSNNAKPVYINPLGAEVVVGSTGAAFRPNSDNAQNLGTAGNRWAVVYAGTGAINTSDEREKQDICALDDAEKRVATVLKGMIKKFKFKDAVQSKGDGARMHFGVIAQEVMAAFQTENLDPMQYAVVCYDKWDAEVDEDGNEIRPAGNRYGVRYEELLAFIISAI